MDLANLTIDVLRIRAHDWAQKLNKYRCIVCGYVGRHDDFRDGRVTCPNCGDSGRYRNSFPANRNYESLLQSMHILFNVPDESIQSIVVNIFVTTYELWFEELFVSFMLSERVTNNIVDHIVNEARSFERKKRLFHVLSKVHFDQAIERIGETDTIYRIEHFVRLRNNMVHSGDMKIDTRTLQECLNLAEKLPEIFRKLNNDYLLWKKPNTQQEPHYKRR